MHSPEVLAFSILSPFPKITKRTKSRVTSIKFGSHFWYIGDYELYFESLVDVWHMEPDGKDALTICEKRWKDKDGKWHYSKAWRWHFWHYKVSPSILYKWRRRLFTRCAECGGPSRKGHVVNHSDNGWYGGPKMPLWCGEINIYHSECMAKMSKRRHDGIHDHEKANCYNCSGAASFRLNRNKANTIPESSPKMPQEQRDIIEELRVNTELGLISRKKALDVYNGKKKEVEWL